MNVVHSSVSHLVSICKLPIVGNLTLALKIRDMERVLHGLVLAVETVSSIYIHIVA